MDFEDTFTTNNQNQSFITPYKANNNSTLDTNPSSNTLMSFNFSKSNILNQSSQIGSKQLISPFKIQQKEDQISNSNGSKSQPQKLKNQKLTIQDVNYFLKIKKLTQFYYNQVQELRHKQKKALSKKESLKHEVKQKEEKVKKYRVKILKLIKQRNKFKANDKSRLKLNNKQITNQYYQLKRKIKTIDYQIQYKVEQINELEIILQKKQQQSLKQNCKTKNKPKQNQPIIYIPYPQFPNFQQYNPKQLYYPYHQMPPQNHQINSMKSSTHLVNINNQSINKSSNNNELQNFNSFGNFLANGKSNLNQNNKKNEYVNDNVKSFKKVPSKKSIHNSIKKWEGDQEDANVIKLLSQSQKCRKTQNRQEIVESVININMEASIKKTQNNLKTKNILNKYELSPREESKTNSQKNNQYQLNHNRSKQLNSLKRQYNLGQSSIHIDVQSDQHSRSNSYEDTIKEQKKKINQQQIVRSPTVETSKKSQEIFQNFQNKSQVLRISQQQNSGLSTPMFTGKESPNLKLTNPIFQLQNLVQSKSGQNISNFQSTKLKKTPIHPVSPVNVQIIQSDSSDEDFTQISLQIQSKITNQDFSRNKGVKSQILKSKKQVKKQQKNTQNQNANKPSQIQNEQNEYQDDFMDSINLLAVSRISKQKQNSIQSFSHENEQIQENFGQINSNLRQSNPSKIIKKGNNQVRQLNIKKSQRYSNTIPMTVEEQQQYQDEPQVKKVSTARNSDPTVNKVLRKEDKKDLYE